MFKVYKNGFSLGEYDNMLYALGTAKLASEGNHHTDIFVNGEVFRSYFNGDCVYAKEEN